MRKSIFSAVTILAANLAFGQITLEHTFVNNELEAYTNATETFYFTSSYNSSTISIYNADYTLRKQFTPTIPAGYEMHISPFNPFSLSKNIFNTDNLLEIVVNMSRWDSTTNSTISIIRIYNEDGILIKDFGGNYREFDDGFDFHVYHDNTTGTNKLLLYKVSTNSTEVYNLNTTSLAAKEVQIKNKLSAFPVPTNKILNIVNPHNGANKIEIFDTSGKLVFNNSFTTSEDKISIDVESLPKGIYFYKVGDLSSKFIKN